MCHNHKPRELTLSALLKPLKGGVVWGELNEMLIRVTGTESEKKINYCALVFQVSTSQTDPPPQPFCANRQKIITASKEREGNLWI